MSRFQNRYIEQLKYEPYPHPKPMQFQEGRVDVLDTNVCGGAELGSPAALIGIGGPTPLDDHVGCKVAGFDGLDHKDRCH